MDVDKLTACNLAARLDWKAPAQTEHQFGSSGTTTSVNFGDVPVEIV